MAPYHSKAVAAQNSKHPQPVQRGGSKIGVPSGDKSGGHAKDSSYAVPHSHQMDTRKSGGSFPGANSAANSKTQVPMQPLVPYDQNDMQDASSAAGGGTSLPQAGFGRLAM